MAAQSKLDTVWQPTMLHRRTRAGVLMLVMLLALGRKQLLAFVRRRVARSRGPPGVVADARKMTLDDGLEQLYLPTGDKDGSEVLLVPTHGRLSTVLVHPTSRATFEQDFPAFSLPPPVTREAMRRRTKMLGVFGGISPKNLRVLSETEAKATPTPGESVTSASAMRVGVDREFFRQLRAIFRILVPSLRTKEVSIFLLHTLCLVLRTYLSLLVARLDGLLVRALISADGPGFIRGLGLWFALAVPATYTNAMIRYLQSKLAIGFRTRLTRYVHDLYMNVNRNYYKVMNLDNRLEAVSQYITSDIARFCELLADLYSNLSKPILDIVIFLSQIGSSLGARGVIGIMASYYIASQTLRKVSPQFGKLAAIEAKLEGEFRNAHSRMIINAEEIAFYNGASTEEGILRRLYRALMRHTFHILRLRIGYSFAEDFVLKYTWSAIGYVVIALPTFAKRDSIVKAGASATDAADRSVANKTESYISNRRLLISLADAGSRLMYSYKGIAELAGQTSRVYSLISTLQLLDHGIYQSVPRPVDLPADVPFFDIGHLHGTTELGEQLVKFDKAPIVTPAPGQERGGELLVRGLSLAVKPGNHILVTGPNGVGKTAIARVIAGLWPLFNGKLERPVDQDIMFLPQRPYLTTESLRDQVIYPYSYQEHIAAGRTDADLLDILRHAHLAYLPEREGGWGTRKEWKDVLSGGEKQRMGMARLFYHHPRFAVLDECTSAVSTDVEGLMYSHAKDLGITLITISHRPSLFKHHHFLLDLKGEHGAFEVISLLGDEKELTIDQEMHELETKLEDVDVWKARLAEINRELMLT
ncbi:ATP-binding cassette long-chain fatty acid transporter pxa1 [Malassezia sp. CBS 17886]|nr:ATP-binding cassette long-chain fatty acid transporter pxa1 [Malassezia sp. CBS 17886]